MYTSFTDLQPAVCIFSYASSKSAVLRVSFFIMIHNIILFLTSFVFPSFFFPTLLRFAFSNSFFNIPFSIFSFHIKHSITNNVPHPLIHLLYFHMLFLLKILGFTFYLLLCFLYTPIPLIPFPLSYFYLYPL